MTGQILSWSPEFHPQQQDTNRRVVAAAQEYGCRVYLVGGYLRDALLGRFSAVHPPQDFDYTVLNGSAIEFARFLQQHCGGHFVLLDSANDTARLVLDTGTRIDLAGCVGGDIKTDAARRDLTINTLFWDPQEPDRIIDLVGGLADLQARLIRAVGEKAFVEDPLRLLRVFRFAAALDFSIDDETLLFVSKHAALLDHVAVERVSYEFFLILETGLAGRTVKAMGAAGLLEQIFPELQATHRVPPNSYHHLPLYDHSLEALAQSEKIVGLLPEWVQEQVRQTLSNNVSRLAVTKLAALLHDVGKPDTWAVTEAGKHTFIGHDKLGAQICEKIAVRLKWSRPIDKLVSNLVAWHLRPAALFHQGLPTERAVNRFYRAVSHDLPELILLSLSDFGATCGPGLKEGRELLENQLRELLTGYVVFREGREKTPRLLDGSDVMKLLGIQPGPLVGELLAQLEEAQDLKEVVNKQQAESYIKSHYQQKYSI